MIALTQALTLALGLSATTNAFNAVILADDDRNGIVDMNDNHEHKDKWTPERGGYFMPNIGDTNQRCAGISKNLPTDALSRCHDAADQKQRNSQYLADVQVLPVSDLPSTAEGFLKLVASSDSQEKYVKENVRLFQLNSGGNKETNDDWRFFDTLSNKLTYEELKAGVHLGIDSRDFSRPNGWDGLVSIQLEIRETKDEAGDKKDDGQNDGPKPDTTTSSVQLRVAPLLINNNLQALEQIYTVSNKEVVAPEMRAAQEKFVTEITNHAHAEKIEGGVKLFDHKTRWIQDWFESGYTSIPGEEGPKVLRVLIMANSIKILQSNTGAAYLAPDTEEHYPARKAFLEMRSNNIGAVQVPFPADYNVNMKYLSTKMELMGNLEGIPPFKVGDKSYPKGGFIMGTNSQLLNKDQKPLIPGVAGFLSHQADDILQVTTDTGYLFNGHIDEIMHILPFDNELGFIVLFVDPEAGMKLLRQHEQAIAMPKPDNAFQNNIPWGRPRTVAEVIKSRKLIDFNKSIHDKVQQNIKDFTQQTGIDEKYIIRIPTVFYRVHQTVDPIWDNSFELFHGDDKNPPPLPQNNEPIAAASLFGNIANGILLNAKHYLAPKPWGPEAAGKSVFEEEALKVFRQYGIKISFMDEWWSHHVNVGEIHCGTNGLRDTSSKWWLPFTVSGTTTHTETTTTSVSSSNSNSNSNSNPTLNDESDNLSGSEHSSDNESNDESDNTDYNEVECPGRQRYSMRKGCIAS